MKVSTAGKEENLLVLRVQDITPAYINTLRRYMASEVPSMAIDFVEFTENNSILYDEMVAHRLGLIPLTTDLKSYKLPEGDWVEPTQDPRVEVQLTLDVPAVKEDTLVTAKDLTSKDSKVKPVHEDMPIVKLIAGQGLRLIATARLGQGKEHVKWAPAHVWYRHFPHITITKQPADPAAIAEQYPAVFELKGGKLALKKGAEYLWPDVEHIADGIEVTFTDGDYLLYVESFGQIPSDEIVRQAVARYDADLDQFAKLAKELKA